VELVADILLAVAGGYLAVGLAVGAWFIVRHLHTANPAFAALPISLKLLLLPAAVGLWPMMLAIATADRGVHQRSTPPIQATARQQDLHRLSWWLVAPASVMLILAGATLSRSTLPLDAAASTAGKAPQP